VSSDRALSIQRLGKFVPALFGAQTQAILAGNDHYATRTETRRSRYGLRVLGSTESPVALALEATVRAPPRASSDTGGEGVVSSATRVHGSRFPHSKIGGRSV
jgi:hypothetical protein